MKSINQKLGKAFTLDPRSLALFRVGLGLILLLDLFNRIQDLSVHYSDSGLFPRLASLSGSTYKTSIHMMSGLSEVQALLFFISAVFAILLILGYKTRLMTLLSWLMLFSLQNKSFLFNNSGDILLRVSLFFSIFLPLGSTFSIDSALSTNDERNSKSVLSLESSYFIFQLIFLYFFAALFKDNSYWHGGTAVYYAIGNEGFTTSFGKYIFNYPMLMKALTHVSFYIELLVPLLLLIPFKNWLFRLITISIFVSMHVGFSLTLEVGLFSIVAINYWLALLPTQFWEFAELKFFSKYNNVITIFFDENCGFCKKMVYVLRSFLLINNCKIEAAQSNDVANSLMVKENSWVVCINGIYFVRFKAVIKLFENSKLFFWMAWVLHLSFIQKIGDMGYEWVSNNRQIVSKWVFWLKFSPQRLDLNYLNKAIIGFFFILIIFINISKVEQISFKVPNWAKKTAKLMGLNQNWRMFAKPSKASGWFIAEGIFENGTTFDLYQDRPISFEKPKLVSSTYKNQRWRKYIMNIKRKKNKKYRKYFTRYLCRKYKKSQVQLGSVQLFWMSEKTLDNYKREPISKIKIGSRICI